MSEADTLKPPSDDDDWETIAFPDAVKIETLEQGSLESEEIEDPQNLAEALALIEQLRQRDRQLSDRLEALNTQLNSKPPAPQTSETVAAGLSGKKLHRHSAPQEQNLLQTLREKLETNQQRMAQMERECALTQQRYQETAHQLQQAEKTSQELRSRLQRQQRYALQLKVALEKCLDEVASQKFSRSETRSSSMQAFCAKAEPVQPWSFELKTEEETPPPTVQVPTSGLSKPHLNSDSPWTNLTEGLDSNPVQEEEDAPRSPCGETETSPPPEEMPETLSGSEAETPAHRQVLPPELAPKKRQSLADLDLPKFPRLP